MSQSKELTIIVNGRSKTVAEKELSFDAVVDLAFENPQRGDNIVFTITYRKGEDKKPEGTLVGGQTIKIKEGMIFNVTRTDQS